MAVAAPIESGAHRPRNVDWKRAAALLYGDWGTSKAYVLGLAFLAVGIFIAAHHPRGLCAYRSRRNQLRDHLQIFSRRWRCLLGGALTGPIARCARRAFARGRSDRDRGAERLVGAELF